MRVDDFDFTLPEDRIALSPTTQRDAARLLHVGEALTDRNIRDLPSLLRAGDVLVMNDTKVIPAQLSGERAARADGGNNNTVCVDVTLHKDLGENQWRAFVRPAKRIRADDTLVFSSELSARVLDRNGPEATLAFTATTSTFEEALAKAGAVPIPPYIARKRAVSAEDEARYQTVYAKEAGSVAAPTAGLHFTDELLATLGTQGVLRTLITLHVGAGTFLPVSVDDTSAHKMHSEWGEITQDQADTINTARRNGGRIIAVGTTSLRLLESAADDDGIVHPFAEETDIFITPGYQFKAVDALLTNFHLPRSTLFMLVCALAGTKTMKTAYAHAIANAYRFYSYGDACFLERSP